MGRPRATTACRGYILEHLPLPLIEEAARHFTFQPLPPPVRFFLYVPSAPVFSSRLSFDYSAAEPISKKMNKKLYYLLFLKTARQVLESVKIFSPLSSLIFARRFFAVTIWFLLGKLYSESLQSLSVN